VMKGAPEVAMREEYILLSFMEKTKGDLLKWPSRLDKVLTVCGILTWTYPYGFVTVMVILWYFIQKTFEA
jgi:hypothetical protein